MPLPEDFNEWEHLQHTLRRVHNEAVRDFYRSQPDNDISTSRSAAKHACLMKDNDTSSMTVLRFWLFWVVCRKMRDNFEPYYGVSIDSFDAEVKYRPRITCYFLEEPQDVEPGYRKVEGELSVRLMNELATTLTQSDLQNYANKVNLAFGQGNGFVWKKGKELYTYIDKVNGIRFKVLTRNQTDAVEIIQKLLSLTNQNYDASFLKKNEAVDPISAFPTIPPNQTVLGKTYREPRKRPIADVRFLYACIKIWGTGTPIILVDKTGYWNNAIIRAY